MSEKPKDRIANGSGEGEAGRGTQTIAAETKKQEKKHPISSKKTVKRTLASTEQDKPSQKLRRVEEASSSGTTQQKSNEVKALVQNIVSAVDRMLVEEEKPCCSRSLEQFPAQSDPSSSNSDNSSPETSSPKNSESCVVS